MHTIHLITVLQFTNKWHKSCKCKLIRVAGRFPIEAASRPGLHITGPASQVTTSQIDRKCWVAGLALMATRPKLFGPAEITKGIRKAFTFHLPFVCLSYESKFFINELFLPFVPKFYLSCNCNFTFCQCILILCFGFTFRTKGERK